ncbi:MAG: T9SS type A sorting domain-containing protein [Melioribacteraceae bacterium]|nr:T9SS type A sorting domain-containing protein [Melioribacteraceae bacterium]
MKQKFLLFVMIAILGVSYTFAQTSGITAENMAAFTVPNDPTLDSAAYAQQPYMGDLGVRRVIVADADGDGEQEIVATDYTNGGRVHVMKVVEDGILEIVWSSPAYDQSSGSTPRYPQVGDCDGDGMPEIVFEQRYFPNEDGSTDRIAFFEWNGTDWGEEAAFAITTLDLENAGGREGMRTYREVLTVYDVDGDGRTEIFPHGNSPRKDVLIIGVKESFPGFAYIEIEGGKPNEQWNGGDWSAGGSYWNTVPADIDGDGEIELVNHTWNYYGFWSIDVKGPDTYVYPMSADNATAKEEGAYHEYSTADAVSYFGVQAVDVNGDGRDEIVGSKYSDGFDLTMHAFSEADTGVYIWKGDSASLASYYNVIAKNSDISALAGRSYTELWPIVKGDVNKDGKDEIYTGGGAGINLVAIEYKGEGELLDPDSYTMNIVYDGTGGDVFATWNIYNGRATYTYDTTYVTVDSMVIDTTAAFDGSVVDTVKVETPFTSYIFADNVDLDGDGTLEIVLSEQSVYDSVSINIYNWVDTIGVGQWELDLENSFKVFNDYRQTVRVLEYTGPLTGFSEQTYSIITPEDYKLEQNYPNPFNPSTTIKFSLPVDKKISMVVYDMLGREVKTLINNQTYRKGGYEIAWDGTNNFGSRVSSGNYVVRLQYGSFAKSIKMTLLK